MAPPSSGGTTVGEALNILEGFDLSTLDRAQRAAPLPGGVAARLRRPQPLRRRPRLRRRAARRPALRRRSPPSARCLIGPTARCRARSRRATRRRLRRRAPRPPRRAAERGTEGTSTTTSPSPTAGATSSSYTLTIEQTGGSGIAVPGPRLPAQQRADRLRLRPPPPACPTRTCPAGGKRPALEHGADDRARATASPCLALGSPGRRDDHHDRAADPARPPRPRACRCRRRSRRRAPRSATRADDPRRAGFIGRRTAPRCAAARPELRARPAGDRRRDRRRVPAGRCLGGGGAGAARRRRGRGRLPVRAAVGPRSCLRGARFASAGVDASSLATPDLRARLLRELKRDERRV